MKILVVENDFLQYDWLEKSLEQTLPDAELDHIKTEQAFQQRFEELARKPPDIIIMDVMLQWTEANEELEALEDESIPGNVQLALDEGPYRAGLRCEEMLAHDSRTKAIPVILYTILEHKDLEADFLEHDKLTHLHLRKDSVPEPLIRLIREVARHAQP
jgi:CheY-like chemotaxis protein